MPFIQRNLFPRRPPSKKCNGPSVLQSVMDTIPDTNHKRSKSKVNDKVSNKKSVQKSDSSAVILNQSLAIDQIPNSSKTENIVKFLDNYESTQSDPQRPDMISRRTILSRSCDDHDLQDIYDTDVWFSLDKLTQNHIQEVLMKWDQIDDEIWAKIICMERNRRVAKAYARAPVLTINGGDNGFDGFRIGLNGFDNPMRDPKTEEIKRHIGLGVKVKMDQDGNILVKRCSKTAVYVKGWQKSSNITSDESMTSVSNEIIKANGSLDSQKSVKLFDMKKFQSNVYRELKSAYPDRRKLEEQCISFIGFVKDANEVLDVPVWVMIINIVALDMLKSKLPPITENPYATVPSSESSNKSMNDSDKCRPPRLPPRDVMNKRPPLNLPKPDYESNDSENDQFSDGHHNKIDSRANNKKREENPYYSGFSARVPNFTRRGQSSGSNGSAQTTQVKGEPPVLRKSSSKGLLSRAHRSGSHHDLTHSLSTDSFLSKMNGNHSISSGYISGSNTNTLRSDCNDIYGINHKYLQNRYPFNLRPDHLSSIQMAQKFSPKGRGLVVGDWE